MRGFDRWLRSNTTTDAGLKPCFSKAAYSTEKLVKEVMDRRQTSTSDRLRYYKCDICGCYHLTKSPARIERKSVEPEKKAPGKTGVSKEEGESYRRKYIDLCGDIRVAIDYNEFETAKKLKDARKLLAKEMKKKGYEVP